MLRHKMSYKKREMIFRKQLKTPRAIALLIVHRCSQHWMHYINAQVGDSRLVLCQRPSDLEVREVLRLTEILRGTEESKRWNQNVWPLHFIITGCFPQIHECFATPHSRLRFLKMLCTHWTVNEPLPANVVSYTVRCATQLGHRCSNCYLWRQPRTNHVTDADTG